MKEAQVIENPQAITLRPEQPVGEALPASEIKPPVTAAQAKVEAVASLTMQAYQQASTLKLTAEEVSALQAEFPDEAFKPGAAGKEHLIYIEHAFLRDRLNQVFGPGQWSIIPRSRWAEPFTTGRGVEGSRVYVEAMLVIRGAFVAEAIGAMEYYPKNESQNYGDAVEGAKTAALRRCAKELGIGLQAWKQDWCNGWWQRKRKGGQNAPGRSGGVSTSTQSNKTAPTPKPATPSPTKSPPVRPPQPAIFPDSQTRERLIRMFADCRELAKEYFEQVNALLPTEQLEDLPLRFVPVTKRQFEGLQAAMAAFGNGEEAMLAFPPHQEPEPKKPEPKPEPKKPEPAPQPKKPEPDANKIKTPSIEAAKAKDPEWFWKVLCPIPHKGEKRDAYLKHPDSIGSLYRAMKEGDKEAQSRLWGFAKHWNPEPRTVGNRTYPVSAEEVAFREALDAFCDWEEKHGKDTEHQTQEDNDDEEQDPF